MNAPLPREKELRARFDRTRMGASRLAGVRDTLLKRKSDLETSVSQAKGRLTLGEGVGSVIEALQSRSHERSVGSFERLLSAIVRDVLPGKGNVKLDLGIERGSASLDVLIDNNGNVEDVLESNGGAVTNVISTGLRYAALSRTRNRRLPILDEADCWIKPERVPAYVGVVCKVSEAIGIQTLMISHHEEQVFRGRATVIRMTKDEQGLVSAHAELPLVADWTDEETPGIRSIELVNVGPHAHTTVPCYPGVNAFVGDNDLGKSTAIARSLRAVAYGESTDRMIRHGEEEARIVLRLEKGQRIEWSRQPKRNPVVLYKLFEGDELIKEGRPGTRNSAPDWVTDVLGVTSVDDLDIQVCNQKQPVFLLQEAASKRAKILSVGRESGHLAAFMGAYESLKRTDKELARNGEIELRALNYKAGCCEGIAPLVECVDALQPGIAEVEESTSRADRIRNLVSRADSACVFIARGERELAVLNAVPELPRLEDTASLGRLIQRFDLADARAKVKPQEWAQVTVPELAEVARIAAVLESLPRLERVARLAPAIPALPELAGLADVSGIDRLLATLPRLERIARLAGAVPELPEIPELDENKLKGLMRVGKQIVESQAALKAAQKDLAECEAALIASEAELTALKEELGGNCPLCGSVFPEKGLAHDH